MKIVAVRIGNRYGPEYEEYLESKLPEYEFHWIRSPQADNIKLQWNKMLAMSFDQDEPLCVIDIDILLINNYKDIFEYPINRGQFLAAPGWWRDLKGDEAKRFTINGGFYKYYPRDCRYIYDRFMEYPEYWQRKYIEEGFTTGPVNGEQFFVEDTAKEQLEVITLPNSWFCRMEARETRDTQGTITTLNKLYRRVTGNDYMFLGNEFHPDIKFVHFTNMSNHPKNWKNYHLFV